MENFTMAELGVFIGVLGGVVTSIILTIQKSKCETISCCGIMCKRNLTTTKKTPPETPPETPNPETPNPRTPTSNP
jgi:hypothetical protein